MDKEKNTPSCENYDENDKNGVKFTEQNIEMYIPKSNKREIEKYQKDVSLKRDQNLHKTTVISNKPIIEKIKLRNEYVNDPIIHVIQPNGKIESTTLNSTKKSNPATISTFNLPKYDKYDKNEYFLNNESGDKKIQNYYETAFMENFQDSQNLNDTNLGFVTDLEMDSFNSNIFNFQDDYFKNSVNYNYNSTNCLDTFICNNQDYVLQNVKNFSQIPSPIVSTSNSPIIQQTYPNLLEYSYKKNAPNKQSRPDNIMHSYCDTDGKNIYTLDHTNGLNDFSKNYEMSHDKIYLLDLVADSGIEHSTDDTKMELDESYDSKINDISCYEPSLETFEIENKDEAFIIILQEQISSMQDITSDRLTYINRGQYYMLKIMMNPLSTAIEKLELNTTITSLIIITFREEYELQEELSMWEFWLARQEKKPRRIINIGYVKDNDSIAYEYLSLNSLSIKWNISTKYVSVPISIHCLSTDFTPQKGVKGVPLHIQVDSYVMSNKLSAFHSAFSQIKVFRDKGAGRKMRDEKKKLENMKKNNQFSNNLYHKQTNYTLFYRINNQKRKPLLFNPMQNKKFDEIENDQTDSEMPIISEQVNCEDSVKDNYNFDSISPTFSADYPKEETIHLIDEKPIIEQIDNVEPPDEECIIVNNKKYISTSTSTQEDSILIYIKLNDDYMHYPLLVKPATRKNLIFQISMKFKLRDAINSICKRFLSGLHVEISDDLITGNVFKTDRGYEILYDNYGNVIIGECSPEIKMLKYKYPLTTFKCIVPKCEHDE